MTAAELIHLLQPLPPDTPVCTCYRDSDSDEHRYWPIEPTEVHVLTAADVAALDRYHHFRGVPAAAGVVAIFS